MIALGRLTLQIVFVAEIVFLTMAARWLCEGCKLHFGIAVFARLELCYLLGDMLKIVCGMSI